MRDPGLASRAAGVLCALVALVSLAACSSSSDGGAASPPSSAPAPRSVPLQVRLVKVTGALSKPKRATVRARAGAAVDGWWRAAYLSSGGGDRFPGFTSGAAALAKRDQDLLSNAALGNKVSGGVAVRRQLDLDVLAVRGKAVGVTARLHLTYDTTGAAHRRCYAGGTVSLVPQGRRWRIFGYDVSHHCAAVPAATSSTTRATTGSEGSKR